MSALSEPMAVTAAPPQRPQQILFELNRSLPTAANLTAIERIEAQWIVPHVERLTRATSPVRSRREWLDLLHALLDEERSGSDAGRYLAEQSTRAQFTHVVREFALDGLTEAQNFFPAVPRLPIRAQMAIMRVLIDEFGCGNIMQAHSMLYADLLTELGLPCSVDDYIASTEDETYRFLNSFYWLALRAPRIEYFLGALAYLESSIPNAFRVQARACERLRIAGGRYYTEHLHIDTFHTEELQVAIREVEKVDGLDATRLWVGARLLSGLLDDAFEAAVDRARTLS
ncbi:iron-containing redox enzyme family protein [Pseudonocardia sp. NPDC049635]|uniref:iron-containing redox enzyme family protein n=1 Tax=Pseudonocardia sp. NPDC049635 TaxID=3155506 RepID=UPI0033C98993